MATQKVYKYYFPDMRGNVSTKAGAEKKARMAYQRNKDEIDAVFSEQGGRLRKGVTIEDWFTSLVMDNLSEEYGGKDKKHKGVKIREAMEISFRSHALTRPGDVAKRNILNTLKQQEPTAYWAFYREHRGNIDAMISSIEWQGGFDLSGYRFYDANSSYWFMYSMMAEPGKSPEWELINFD